MSVHVLLPTQEFEVLRTRTFFADSLISSGTSVGTTGATKSQFMSRVTSSPVHLCHPLLCQHCTCVHFRRALESQAKRCFHVSRHIESHRSAHCPTLVGEQVTAHFVIPRLVARAHRTAAEDACLFQAATGGEEIHLRPSDQFIFRLFVAPWHPLQFLQYYT